MKKHTYTLLAGVITAFLFFIPFGWLKPGEMDLGGDNSRLYFYDPLAYLVSQSLYSVSHSGLGGEILSYFGIPFFLLLAAVKSVVGSPTILISIFHGLNLSMGFFFCYLIVSELVKREDSSGKHPHISHIAGILAGLYYTLSPNPIRWWGYPILSMNLVFINPLMFWLMLRFFVTDRFAYLLAGVLVTFIFSPNFSYAGAPTFFSFFPLAGMFLLGYAVFVRRKAVPAKQLLIGIVLFAGVQAFHLVPQISSILTPGSYANQFIFGSQGKLEWGLKYFLATVPSIKISYALLGLPQYTLPEMYSALYTVFPLMIVAGLLWNKSRLYLLCTIFFLITLYFVSANITNLGVALYAYAFRLPGFAMFRVFYGQWQWAYLFFFTVLSGVALSVVLGNLRRAHRYVLTAGISALFLLTSWPLLTGKLTDTTLWQSKNVSSHVQMDPQYEEALSFVRSLPVDGKIITFPLNDHGYQVVKGANNAAYEGPSTITYIAGRNEFNGVAEFSMFDPELLSSAREGDIAGFRDILSLLNIRYIFYNEDPYIYGENFPGLPYTNVRKYFPATQEGYKEFIRSLGSKEVRQFAGKYSIYEFDDSSYTPHIYTAKDVVYWNDVVAADPHTPLSFFPEDKRVALFDDRNIYSLRKELFDTVLLKARNSSTIFDFFKRKKLERFVSPTISRELTSPIYPLVIFKEQRDLSQYPVGSDAYIDRSLYFAEKRINELYILRDIPVRGDTETIAELARQWKMPEPWDIPRFTEINSWEITLARYMQAMEKLIRVVEGTTESDYSSITSKVEIKRYLREHKIKLRDALREHSSLSHQNRAYLSHLIEDMFVDMYRMLNLDLPDYGNIPFVLDDSLGNGTYEVYVNTRDMQDLDVTLLAGGEKLIPKSGQDGEWVRFSDITVADAKPIAIMYSVSNLPNLVSATRWTTAEQVAAGQPSPENTMTLTIKKNDLGDTSGMVRDISGWEGDTMYALSFEYLTHDRNFQMALREKGGSKNDTYISDVYDETLRSREWRKLSNVVLSAKDADAAFIQITKSSDDVKDADPNREKQIEIRNLLVQKIYNPKIVLKSSLRPSESPPSMTFTQINPTKYAVDIKDIRGPFTLVFSQAYNQKWKLYHPAAGHEAETVRGALMRLAGVLGRVVMDRFMPPVSGKEEPVVEFAGTGIGEGKHGSVFLDRATFETWGIDPIAEKTHLPVNGYANAWHIRPEDLDNQSSVSLIIEISHQKIFYLSSIVSLGAVLATGIMLLGAVLKRT